MIIKRLTLIGVTIFLASIALLALLLLLASLPVRATPDVRYVASGGCGSASPCYSSVQAALDAAQAGDEIRVAAGTYSGVNNQGGLAQVVYIDKSLTIRGGFTTADWNTPDPDANPTELQAQTLGRVVYIAGTNTVVTLEGLRMTYGASNGLGGHSPTSYQNYDAGGGIYANQSSLTLDRCWLAQNASPSNGYGGGLYVRDGILTMTETTLNENEAGSGAAIFLYNSQSLIGSNSVLQNNRKMGGGAAVRVVGGEFTMSHSLVETTSSFGGDGGGVSIEKGAFLIENSVISGTKGLDGISLFKVNGTLRGNVVQNSSNVGVSIGDGTMTLVDNEILYNRGLDAGYGGGVKIDALSALSVTLVDNYIHHNVDDYAYCKGAGVYIDARVGSIALVGNVTQDNFAGDLDGLPAHGYGGGLHILGDNAVLERNLIQRNTAIGFIHAGTQYWGGFGGGVYIAGDPTLKNNIITDNAARFKGSGVYIVGSAPSLYHNTIAQNSHGGDEATGVYVVEASATERAQPRLYNTIVASQTVGIYAAGETIKNIVNVEGVLWSGNISNTWGSGTFFLSNEATGEPVFIDPAGGDYHVGIGSAVLDRGAVVANVTDDVDDQSRPHYGGYDLGADEMWVVVAAKSAAPAQVEPGETVTFTIVLTNTTAVSTSVRLTDTLPAQIVTVGPISYTGGLLVHTPGLITWTGMIPPVTPTRIAWAGQVVSDVQPGAIISNVADVQDAGGVFQTDPAVIVVSESYRYVYLPLVLRGH